MRLTRIRLKFFILLIAAVSFGVAVAAERKGFEPGTTRAEIDESQFPDEFEPKGQADLELDGIEWGKEDVFEVPSELTVIGDKVGFFSKEPTVEQAKEHYEKQKDFTVPYDGHYQKGDRLEVIEYVTLGCLEDKCFGTLSFYKVQKGNERAQYVFRNDWSITDSLNVQTQSDAKPNPGDQKVDPDKSEQGPTETERPDQKDDRDQNADRETKEPEKRPKTTPAGEQPTFSLDANNKGYAPVPVSQKIIKTKRGAVNAYCGSYHYYARSNSAGLKGSTPDWNTNFKEPVTCAFMLFAEKWNAEGCEGAGENNRGCRLSFGDASRKKGGFFKGHRSHQRGLSVDIRLPMHFKTQFRERNFKYSDRSYSRKYTQKMVNMLRDYGAVVVLFNDPKVKGVQYWKGHANHLHVRFNLNKAKKICAQRKMNAAQIQYRQQCPK